MLEMLLQWYRRRFTDPQAIALLAILVAGFCILYFLHGILAPLLVAIVLAYLLEWPVVRLQYFGLSRTLATSVVLLIFAAGAFTGILNGTGMADAMASAALSVLPPQVGPLLAPITALASMPLTFVMSNDAYYFGVVPVIANAAASFGIAPEAIARASLIGQPVHALSPLLAPIYLACGLLGVDVADAQRFALKWAVLVCLIVLAAALATGAVPLVASGVPLG